MRGNLSLQALVFTSLTLHGKITISKRVVIALFFTTGLLNNRYFPEEFLDYYPDDVLDVPDNQYAPVNMPEKAWNVPPIFRQFTDTSPEALGIPDIGNINVTLPEWKASFLVFMLRELEIHIL